MVTVDSSIGIQGGHRDEVPPELTAPLSSPPSAETLAEVRRLLKFNTEYFDRCKAKDRQEALERGNRETIALPLRGADAVHEEVRDAVSHHD